MRLLREPYGQCHNPASLLSLSTQLVVGVTTYKKYRRFNRRYSTNCLQKPATGSFVAEMGIVAKPHLLFLKSNKNKSERTVMKNGNLSSEAKVISRGAGRSAVAASAYLSCSQIYNDYDGIQHDYTRKRGLVWQEVFLPPIAPAAWSDRSILWNAVEENEKTKDSRLAREFVVALPIELGKTDWQSLLTEFIQDNFVAEGMCADVAIHDPYPPGHNPHAHIMLTIRPLQENGKWQHKTEKEYLCVRDGAEWGFTSAEYKIAQAEGWEKQYQYLVGERKVYMAPSEAEKQGYERANKYPKSTKYGRQNPISQRWNSDEQLLIWREKWATVTNRHLAQYPEIDARIDHRSHAARGLDELPTIHEGYHARKLEAMGIVSDRCEINRQIKADNALLRELKAKVKKLAAAVKTSIPELANALESLRENMIVLMYRISHIRISKQKISDYVDAVNRSWNDIRKSNRKSKRKTQSESSSVQNRILYPLFM